MPYKEPTTIREITTSLEKLQDQLSVMIESLGSNHVIVDGQFTDARIVTLRNCKHDIASNIVILNIFRMKETGYMNEDEWKKAFGIYQGGTPLSKIESEIRLYLQLSLITMYQFRIESMITCFLAVLNKKKARGYWEKVEALLNILELNDKEVKLKKLNVLAFMRNSLHSGGVTSKHELDVTIDGFRFHFKRGEKVRYFGWGHIVLAMESSLIIINEILQSKKVKDIPEPISLLYIEPEP